MEGLIFNLKQKKKIKMSLCLIPLFCFILSLSSYAKIDFTIDKPYYSNGSVIVNGHMPAHASSTYNNLLAAYSSTAKDFLYFDSNSTWYVTASEIINAGANVANKEVNVDFSVSRNGATFRFKGIGKKYSGSSYRYLYVCKGSDMILTFPHGTSASVNDTIRLRSHHYSGGSSSSGYFAYSSSVSGLSAMISHIKTCTGGTGGFTVSKAATCAATGSRYRKCSTCGYTYTETIAKTSTHSWGNWSTTKAATCTAAGTQQRKCKVCGTTQTQTINALGHSYGSWTYNSDTQHKRTCSRCGNVVYENHSKVNGYCATCGHYFTAKLIFDNNGGSGGPGTVEKQIGSTYVPSPNPTREGYELDAWGKKGTETN